MGCDFFSIINLKNEEFITITIRTYYYTQIDGNLGLKDYGKSTTIL